MRTRAKKLTWRRAEALLCIYVRIKNYTFAKYEELVGDMGISFNTLPTHILALEEMKLVAPLSKDPKSQPFGMKIFQEHC